ncbi:ADP-ribosylglycohydrolase family protein [Desulfatitalea alkaliphila]|uniref:ADP-ribosylglycohydrolase family protein n=1 Tax=Desulfatitalea alkaliphila TaxID=2929485 RepID=A0AA41UKE3_9BACT|nr:ADP-ribosylglycohydrolase family protein [Desulfatitalea alkaliphila]
MYLDLQLKKKQMKEITKAKGVLYGLAIGDALGWPTEFLKLDQIKSRYGPQGITELPDPALFTDDTQMSIAVARALLLSGEKDIDDIMAALREEFIQWLHAPDNNRAPGNACLQGVANLERGIHWSRSGVPRSKGCGSAMRAAPIGYLYQHDPQKLKSTASASGICTHGHPTADAACIGAAYLVKLALDGTDPQQVVPELLAFTAGISAEFDRAILKINRCLAWEDSHKALSHLGEGWVGEEAVALALYCFLRHPEDYRAVVTLGANTNGDSDSIACIAGAISGAYLGVSAIPPDWIRKIEKSDYLGNLADGLARKKGFFL